MQGHLYFRKKILPFDPSPVTATILPIYIKPVTNVNLSSGVALAKTLKSYAISVNLYIFFTIYCWPSLSNPPVYYLNLSPSITVKSSFNPFLSNIPHS